MAEQDEIQQALRRLKLRLSSGEIDEPTYQRQRELILADLSAEERVALGTATPVSATPTPRPGTPRPLGPLGPSGGSRGGLRTGIPSLSDLDLQPGSVLLDQWKLEKELGRGGFGAVFAAEELHLHEKQAVKVLDPSMVAKEELLARFRREVSLMRKLVHPRIVRVYDYREDLQQLIALISMELVIGGSVKQLMAVARQRELEVPLPLALEILRQTLEALAEAHEQGVIHRDVTPGNVLLAGGSPEQLLADPDRDPKVKLVDFGIAGLVERSELSQKSRVLGTAAYVAPEVLDPNVEVTPAADVYGAGAMGYELLTGKLPLGRFAEPARLRGGLPAAVNTLVLSLLEAQPSERPSARAAQPRVGGLVGEARAASQRRAQLAELEARLASALTRGEESAVAALAGDLAGALAATGETSEVGTRAQSWLATRERERREAAARREREAATVRQHEELARRESEERARQARMQAESEAARAARIEERQTTTAPARSEPPPEKRRGVPAWAGLVAAVVVVALGLFVYQQVEARREAERQQIAAQQEQARQQAEAEERLRQQQAEAAQRLEQEKQRVARDTTERLRRETELRGRQAAEDRSAATEPSLAPPTTAPAASPRASAAALDATAAGSFYVLVVSSREDSKAKRYQQDLLRRGYKAFLSPVERDGQKFYRVSIGPYARRDQAQAVVEKLRKTITPDAIVTDKP